MGKKQSGKVQYIEFKRRKNYIFIIFLLLAIMLVLEVVYMYNINKEINENIARNTIEFNGSSYVSNNSITEQLSRLETIPMIGCIIITAVAAVITICMFISNESKNKKIYNTAYIDQITGLGNDNYFRENAKIYLEKNKQKTNLYIISIDINKFKSLNAVYGYEFCNEILKELGIKISNTFPKGNLTCRIFNDVFAVLFSYDDNIKELLENTVNEISTININNTEIQLNLSIGAYNIKENETEVNKIIDKSYLARRKVKGYYDNNFYIFDEELEKEVENLQEIELGMKKALKNKEFVVYYQPKVSASTEKTVGAEALARWVKNGEVIPSNKFIPIFEQNKFITKVDLYIFEQVCKDLKEWKDKYGKIPMVSINVSKEHFENERFIDKYVKICDKYKIKPSEVELEITESATVDEKIDLIKILNYIKEKGFNISLDDFGTGYSSLSMLQDMPIDIIKIDRVFVNKANLESDHNIINNIMVLAKQLKVQTVVEGVETKEEVEFIRKIEGDIIQGYYYSKPLPKEDFEKYYNK